MARLGVYNAINVLKVSICIYVCIYVCMYIWIRMYVCVYISNRYLSVGDGYGHRNSDCSIGLGHPDHDPASSRPPTLKNRYYHHAWRFLRTVRRINVPVMSCC